MSWFGSDTVESVGNASQKVTSGLRQLFTGEIPPEILKEMDKLDKETVNKRWIADSKIKWYNSSRSIVLLALTLNWLGMTWFGSGMEEYWVNANVSLMMVVAGSFFGGKTLEIMKGKVI